MSFDPWPYVMISPNQYASLSVRRVLIPLTYSLHASVLVMMTDVGSNISPFGYIIVLGWFVGIWPDVFRQ
jgi:hypothetical protein